MPTKKPTTGSFQHSNHQILGGKAKIFRVPKSGDIYQFQLWIEAEKKYLRKTLKTKDLETAILRAETIYLEINSDIRVGKQIFGMTLQQVVDKYLTYRQEDVLMDNISRRRPIVMRSQVRHFLDFVGKDTKINSLDRNSCHEYELHRVTKYPNTQKVTIRNEKSTINAIMRYAYANGYSHIDKLNFRKTVIKGTERSRRNTFTLDEYDQLVRYMRIYVSKKEYPLMKEQERLERLMVRDAILLLSNTMCRIGELLQLKWKDIIGIEKIIDKDGKSISLVTINIRGETSKTGNTRRVPVRGGEYFERIRKRSKFTSPEDYIFCAVGKRTRPVQRFWYGHWKELMNGIGMPDYKQRKITFYSLRHFGISCRIRSKVMLSDIAQLAGTSSIYVENTYGHYDDDMLRDASLKNFSVDTYGIDFKD